MLFKKTGETNKQFIKRLQAENDRLHHVIIDREKEILQYADETNLVSKTVYDIICQRYLNAVRSLKKYHLYMNE